MVKGTPKPLSTKARAEIFDLMCDAVVATAYPELWYPPDDDLALTVFDRVYRQHGGMLGLFHSCGALAVIWGACMEEIQPGYAALARESDAPAFVVLNEGELVTDPDSTGHPEIEQGVWAIRMVTAWNRGDRPIVKALWNTAAERCESSEKFAEYLHAVLELTAEAEGHARETRSTGNMPLRVVLKTWAAPPPEV